MILTITMLCLLGALTLQGQEDIEQYLLTDSLQIEALIGNDRKEEKPRVEIFTSLGLTVLNITSHSDLNQSLLTQGYGETPKTNLGWTYDTRIDIKDHLTLGMSFLSNVMMSQFQAGSDFSSRYSFFTFLLDVGYRQHFEGLHIMPGIGVGFSQSILSLKPNDRESLTWTELFDNNDLVSSVNQLNVVLSPNFSLGKYFDRGEGGTRLLNIKFGLLFHPFSLGDHGMSGGDFSFMKVSHAPSLKNSGFYIALTWG